MWAVITTGHSISHWLPYPVPSWVSNISGTLGGNLVKFSLTQLYISDCWLLFQGECIGGTVLGLLHEKTSSLVG